MKYFLNNLLSIGIYILVFMGINIICEFAGLKQFVKDSIILALFLFILNEIVQNTRKDEK